VASAATGITSFAGAIEVEAVVAVGITILLTVGCSLAVGSDTTALTLGSVAAAALGAVFVVFGLVSESKEMVSTEETAVEAVFGILMKFMRTPFYQVIEILINYCVDKI
jgi:hypothetical protein